MDHRGHFKVVENVLKDTETILKYFQRDGSIWKYTTEYLDTSGSSLNLIHPLCTKFKRENEVRERSDYVSTMLKEIDAYVSKATEKDISILNKSKHNIETSKKGCSSNGTIITKIPSTENSNNSISSNLSRMKRKVIAESSKSCFSDGIISEEKNLDNADFLKEHSSDEISRSTSSSLINDLKQMMKDKTSGSIPFEKCNTDMSMTHATTKDYMTSQAPAFNHMISEPFILTNETITKDPSMHHIPENNQVMFNYLSEKDTLAIPVRAVSDSSATDQTLSRTSENDQISHIPTVGAMKSDNSIKDQLYYSSSKNRSQFPNALNIRDSNSLVEDHTMYSSYPKLSSILLNTDQNKFKIRNNWSNVSIRKKTMNRTKIKDSQENTILEKTANLHRKNPRITGRQHENNLNKSKLFEMHSSSTESNPVQMDSLKKSNGKMVSIESINAKIDNSESNDTQLNSPERNDAQLDSPNQHDIRMDCSEWINAQIDCPEEKDAETDCPKSNDTLIDCQGRNNTKLDIREKITPTDNTEKNIAQIYSLQRSDSSPTRNRTEMHNPLTNVAQMYSPQKNETLTHRPKRDNTRMGFPEENAAHTDGANENDSQMDCPEDNDSQMLSCPERIKRITQNEFPRIRIRTNGSPGQERNQLDLPDKNKAQLDLLNRKTQNRSLNKIIK
ncbi:hypothetical protein NPIL_118131 [Nephila pilipes]|uniref:Uncharacterized protein n=1 Tax=Nephila pilipes TaxID=299642 RepID=A0A8X6Q9G8_NEPPI|nr:hypothetical protein NPIL_118131 [Nephila pilipes]